MEVGLPMEFFKEQAQKDLVSIVSKYPTPRTLVVPESLGVFTFRLMPRETVLDKLFSSYAYTSTGNQRKDTGTVISICTADQATVAAAIGAFSKFPKYNKVLLLIPRSTAFTNQVIIDAGYTIASFPFSTSQELAVHEFHTDFFPVEPYFFLLPSNRSFYQTAIENDFNDLYSAARALAKLQMVFGIIPQVFTMGDFGVRVKSLMQNVISQIGISSFNAVPQVSSLIIFDRAIDLVTPLLTQVTYEGVLDQLLHLEYDTLEYDADGTTKTISITDDDSVFAEIRNMNYAVLGGGYLKDRCMEYSQAIEELGRITSVQQLKAQADRFTKLSNTKVLYDKHLSICENLAKKSNETYKNLSKILTGEYFLLTERAGITPVAENYLLLYNDWPQVLRMLCLDCLVLGHLSKSSFAKIQQEILHEFGVPAQEDLINLEKLHLLSATQSTGWKWDDVFKKLGLRARSDDSNDIGAAFDGFVPLSVRLIQAAIQNTPKLPWSSIAHLFGDKQATFTCEGAPLPTTEGEVQKVLVFFVGGVTITEMNLIRELGKVCFNGKVDFIIGSNAQLNSTSLLNQIAPTITGA